MIRPRTNSRHWGYGSLWLLALLCGGCANWKAGTASANGSNLPRPTFDAGENIVAVPGGGFIQQPTRSWRSIQRQNVVFQRYDYSCGSAALATLLRYYFQDPYSEEVVLTVILRNLGRAPNPQAEIDDRIKQGFSMYDLFLVAQELGYQAAVVRLPLEKLAELPAPSLVRIEKMGYKHFVVVRGIYDETVYLADPTRGNIRLSVDEFQRQWSGEVLVLGKEGFGLPQDHPLALHVDGPARPELYIAREALFPTF